MIEKEILQHLYDNYSIGNVNLLEYLIKKYPSPDRYTLKLISKSLENIERKNGFITVTSDEYNSLGMNDTNGIFDLERIKPHMNYESMSDGILARLTFEGIGEVEKWKFESQLNSVNQSVITTNKFTKLTGGITLFLSLVITAVSIQTCIRDKEKASKEERQQSIDSVRQSKTDKSVEQLTKTLQAISQSLSDSSTKKVKTEK